MFRTVMVHTDFDNFSSDRVDAAIGVARQFDAALIGITAAMPQVPLSVYGTAAGAVAVVPEFTEVERERIQGEFAKGEKLFTAATRDCGLETQWEAVFANPSVAVSRAVLALICSCLGRAKDAFLAMSMLFLLATSCCTAGVPSW